ncbi:MAG: M28 family peptidase [Rubricoccaceae bacterium]|nr:M28 family peptidase [Rubricoccaceae bacterium]
MLRPLLFAAAALAGLSACAPAPVTAQETDPAALALAAPDDALAEIDSTTLYRHLAELASDAYQGRGTGTPGEAMTVEYIAGQMRALGLEGGAADGSFFQPVPLRGSTPTSVSPLVLTPDDTAPATLEFVSDFIASTDLDAEAASVHDAELVFVGYGIENPGYDWDDYKGLDVEGKILVAFVNDPPATEAEPDLFQADTLTYNGRWTYKYEEARRRGALGALLIHTPATAGYPFQVLSAGARGEQISLSEPPEGALTVKGWLTQPSAERLAAMAGASLDQWFAEAATRDFQPRILPVTASLDMTFENRRFEGTNVIGKRTGASAPDEAVAYTAHHDHLGMNEDLIAAGEDGIYNGAVDNASGVSMLLTLAEAFLAAERPARTALFLTLSAEESGLLGAAYYAENPVVPLAHTIANVNVDSGNLSGATEDIVGIGAERSEMLDLLRAAAAAEGMRVTPDNQPNQGIFFRSDQLAFARGGVPAVFIKTGATFVGRPEGYADEVAREYRMNRYHQPADELTGDERLGGLVQQTRVAFRLGWLLADSDLRPQWKPSEAFAQTRADSERAAGM